MTLTYEALAARRARTKAAIQAAVDAAIPLCDAQATVDYALALAGSTNEFDVIRSVRGPGPGEVVVTLRRSGGHEVVGRDQVFRITITPEDP